MNPLQIDPATGFLTSDNHNSFNSDMKIAFLKLAQECAEQERYPSIAKLCRQIGIPIHTFYDHLGRDKEFAGQWKEITTQIEEMLVSHMVENGKKGNGIAGTIFWLKNRVPERWKDKPEEGNSVEQYAWIKKIIVGAKDVIEAEIIPSTTVVTSTTTSTPENTNATE